MKPLADLDLDLVLSVVEVSDEMELLRRPGSVNRGVLISDGDPDVLLGLLTLGTHV